MHADLLSKGYYFASSQEASQIDIAKATGKILKSHGRIQDAEPKQLPLETVSDMIKRPSGKTIGTYMFAANSRTKSERAPKVLGYEPEAPSLWETMEADLLAAIE